MKSLGLVALVVIVFSLGLGFGSSAIALDSSTKPTLIRSVPPAPLIAQNTPEPEKPHLSTPAGDPEETRLAGFRLFLEDQQNAHDKLIVDRFLLGVAVIFAVIAAALLFSLPPKPREQKE